MKDGSFVKQRKYSHQQTQRLFQATADVLGMELHACLEEFGEHFFTYCRSSGYERILRVLGGNLLDFLSNMDVLHDQFESVYPDMWSSSFRALPTNDGSLTLHYRSRQKGLYPILSGFVRSVAKEFFDTNITVAAVVKPQRTSSVSSPEDKIHTVKKQVRGENQSSKQSNQDVPSNQCNARDTPLTSPQCDVKGIPVPSPQCDVRDIPLLSPPYEFRGIPVPSPQYDVKSPQNDVRGLPGDDPQQSEHVILTIREHYDADSVMGSGWGAVPCQRRRTYSLVSHLSRLKNSTNPRDLALKPRIFCKTFPFHVVLNRRLEITQAGSALSRVINALRRTSTPNREPCLFTDLFTLERPLIDLTFDRVLNHINTVFVAVTKPGVIENTSNDDARLNCGNNEVRHYKHNDGHHSIKMPDKSDATHLFPFFSNDNDVNGSSDVTKTSVMRLKGQMVFVPESDSLLFLCSPRVSNLDDLKGKGLFLSDIPIHDATRDLILIAQARRAERELVEKLEETSNNLKKLQAKLQEDKRRTDDLLHSILPFGVADKLRLNQTVEAEKFPLVTVLFSDIVGFTSMCGDENVVPMDIIRLLNKLYTQFDMLSNFNDVHKMATSVARTTAIGVAVWSTGINLDGGQVVSRYRNPQLQLCLSTAIHNFNCVSLPQSTTSIVSLYRNPQLQVETIGDAYMVVAGMPDFCDTHADDVVSMAFGMLKVSRNVTSLSSNTPIQIRIGIHSGACVAGVVGQKMPRYCLFGDTVAIASLMEGRSRPGHITISETAKSHLTAPNRYMFEENRSQPDSPYPSYYVHPNPFAPLPVAMDLTLPIPKGMFRTPNPTPPGSRLVSPVDSPAKNMSPEKPIHKFDNPAITISHPDEEVDRTSGVLYERSDCKGYRPNGQNQCYPSLPGVIYGGQGGCPSQGQSGCPSQSQDGCPSESSVLYSHRAGHPTGDCNIDHPERSKDKKQIPQQQVTNRLRRYARQEVSHMQIDNTKATSPEKRSTPEVDICTQEGLQNCDSATDSYSKQPISRSSKYKCVSKYRATSMMSRKDSGIHSPGEYAGTFDEFVPSDVAPSCDRVSVNTPTSPVQPGASVASYVQGDHKDVTRPGDYLDSQRSGRGTIRSPASPAVPHTLCVRRSSDKRRVSDSLLCGLEPWTPPSPNAGRCFLATGDKDTKATGGASPTSGRSSCLSPVNGVRRVSRDDVAYQKDHLVIYFRGRPRSASPRRRKCSEGNIRRRGAQSQTPDRNAAEKKEIIQRNNLNL